MVYAGMEQPFERGVSGNGSYLDHEAATSISGGSSRKTRCEVPLRRVHEQQKKNKMLLIARTSLTVDPVGEVFFLITIRPVRYISRE